MYATSNSKAKQCITIRLGHERYVLMYINYTELKETGKK